MEKYQKTCENQNLNDLLPETLAWINSQQQRIISKIMLFLRELLQT